MKKEKMPHVVDHGFHGSPKESHYLGSGEHFEHKHGELTVGSTPGKMAMGIKPHLAGLPFEGGTKDKKVPKIQSTYSEE